MVNASSIFDVSNPTAADSAGVSWKQFLISLSTGFILFTVQVVAFQIIRSRRRFRKIYHPKTYLVPDRQKIDAASANPIKWLLTVLSTKDEELIAKCGIDSYLFTRYLMMMVKIFLPALLIILPILIPLNRVGGRNSAGNITGLDQLGWQNITPSNQGRYWAHLVLAVLFIIYVCYVIYHELMNFISVRQRYLVSPQHRLRSSARTILVKNIPPELASVQKLDELFDVFPDGIRKIWFNRDYTRLENAVSRRNHFAWELEYGLMDMMRNAERKHKKKPERGLHYAEGDPLWKKYVKPSERPRMHIPRFRSQRWLRFLPFWLSWPFGMMKSVDKIDHCASEIDRLGKKIQKMHKELEDFPPGTSAFIQFNSQVAAHMAVQSNIHHKAALLSPRLLEIAPADVRWGSINIHWWSEWIRITIFIVVFFGLILLWGAPLTVVGFLSTIGTTGDKISWLRWITTLPSWAISAIQGVLPPVLTQLLLTVLMPLLFRWMCGLTGANTNATRELQLQGWYFTFIFVELVLVISISAGIFTAISAVLSNPFDGIAHVLAGNLPKVANFFFSYIVLQGLSISAANLLQNPRLLYIVWRKMFNYTPRSEFINRTWCPSNLWGSLFPLYTNMACIGIIYSIIAPLVLVFSTVQFLLFYVVFRNNSLYIFKNDVDTGGLLFSKAVFQLFTGIYFLELVLICLFFLNYNTTEQSCIPQASIMIAVAAFTILFHAQLWFKTQPLINYLPITLEDDAVIADKQLAAQMRNEKSMTEKVRSHSDNDSKSSTTNDTNSVELTEIRPSTSDTRARTTGSIDTNSMRELHNRHAKNKLSDAEKADLEKSDYAHIGDVVGGYDDELENLNQDERDWLIDEAFTNPAIRRGTKCEIWIPQDSLGLAHDEIRRLEELYQGQTFGVSTEGARFEGKKFKTAISGIPPDFEKTWVVEKLL